MAAQGEAGQSITKPDSLCVAKHNAKDSFLEGILMQSPITHGPYQSCYLIGGNLALVTCICVLMPLNLT